MENDLLNITINFAVLPNFKPKPIKREDEIFYRNAAKYVDDRFWWYQKEHPKQGADVHLSLVSLELAIELLKTKKDMDSVCQRTETLLKELEENLKK